ncbi:hypothetical protein Gpo141_00002931 [Globisporangium polare]
MQKLVFSMRDSMPQFVSCLRAIDEWKRMYAKRVDAITQAEYDASAKYIKSPFARSLKIEDLLRFLDDTVLDINFMVQLPSIEKCLEQWWELYAKDKPLVAQDQLRIMYYDLAFVLVEAKTETIHKNAVSMILRSSWTKWSAREPPLSQHEYFRLLFILGHLMTTTNRLGDYVVFFQETLSKIRRHYQSKMPRAQTHKRQPRVHRKSSLAEILTKNNGQRVFSSPNQIEQELASEAGQHQQQSGSNARIVTGTLSVKMDRVQTQGRATRIEDETADRFVEILDRNSRGQHVVIDPLLHEKRFQEKWKRPNGASTTSSSQELVSAQNPQTNKFYPPMFISRVRTGVPLSSSSPLAQCRSVPAIKFKSEMVSFSAQACVSTMNGGGG